MGALRVGATIDVPELDGRWSVWSQSRETPGGYFVVPADAVARATGKKYVTVRAVQPSGCSTPVVSLWGGRA